ncbi:MAG TPA: POT family MFS transporter [Mucilaginibacter sp.]|jgi:POT family proton-dependent oligopeptide transporter|nr:POT family MFS transporter [Mucilaginibacter sp.]
MSETTLSADAVPKKSRFPKAVPFIIGNEAAERFSYYGLRSILVTFLVAQFYNHDKIASLTTTAEAKANEVTHLFVTLSYFMPLVGGILADWYFGKYKVILWISMVYCLGNLFTSSFTTSLPLFSWGLVLIAIGAGGIKSCVSANVGDQFDKSNQDLLSKVYGWFYFSINAGSMVSTVLIPWVYQNYGPRLAFGIPGVLMALATIIFFSGRKMYVRVKPSGVNKNNFLFISAYSLVHIGKKQKGQSWLDVAKGTYDPEKVEGIKAVYRVMSVFFFALAFWIVWDQNLSEWVLQAAKMNRTIGIGSWHFTMLAGQVQTFNPVFLLIFIPVFSYWIYPFFNKIGLKATPLRRLGVGLILTALSFVIIAIAQGMIDRGQTPSIWWQIFAYVVLSAAEVLVSITGLEYAYTHSPKSMKSTMTAIWLMVVSMGNLITAAVNSNIADKGILAKYLVGANYYWYFDVGLVAAFTIAFLLVSPHIKEHNYIENPEPELKNQIIADTDNL